MNITQPIKISASDSNASGKLGRHNLSFATGAHKDRKKDARKYACRGKGKVSDY